MLSNGPSKIAKALDSFRKTINELEAGIDQCVTKTRKNDEAVESRRQAFEDFETRKAEENNELADAEHRARGAVSGIKQILGEESE